MKLFHKKLEIGTLELVFSDMNVAVYEIFLHTAIQPPTEKVAQDIHDYLFKKGKYIKGSKLNTEVLEQGFRLVENEKSFTSDFSDLHIEEMEVSPMNTQYREHTICITGKISALSDIA